jgi:dTDP-4-amino-4,6-dideoxygalactose transaminase
MIRFIRPTIPEIAEWVPFLQEAYRQRVFTNFGPVASRLEQELTEKYGNGQRQAVLTANATAGLTAALLALKVRGPVVVPAFTFVATAQAVLQAGCEPLFADVALETWELDPEALEEIIDRHRVGAIVHVRSFGFGQDLGPIEAIAQRRGIPLLVDAAAALGGRLPDGRWVGGQGDLEVFSLHATKVFGIGEGGLILARPEHVAALRRVLNFGLEAGDVVLGGLNGKLSEFHAAVGLAVLRRIDDFIACRNQVARTYRQALQSVAGLVLPPQAGRAPWQTFPVRCARIDADDFANLARAAGMESRRYYFPALPDTTFFRTAPAGRCDRSRQLAKEMLCLPVYSDMTCKETERVIETIWTCLRQRHGGQESWLSQSA